MFQELGNILCLVVTKYGSGLLCVDSGRLLDWLYSMFADRLLVYRGRFGAW